MNTRSTDSNDLPEALPAAVRARLEASHPAVGVDPAVDEAVLTRARAYFAQRDRGDERPDAAGHPAAARGGRFAERPTSRAFGRSSSAVHRSGPASARGARRRRGRWAASAAAAGVVLAAFLIVQPVRLLGPYDPDDVDRSGRVDILDAFALARMRADGETIAQAQIDAVAMRVVSLEPTGAGR